MNHMKNRFRIIKNRSRGGIYYLVNKETEQRDSLETTSKERANELLTASNEAHREPAFNLQRPKLCARTIRERDGNRCQYTGRVLRPDEGSLDHVVPRSRGGKDAWENLVWSANEVSQKKADRLPHEAGLKPLSVPRAPTELPVSVFIRNTAQVDDWKLFIEG